MRHLARARARPKPPPIMAERVPVVSPPFWKSRFPWPRRAGGRRRPVRLYRRVRTHANRRRAAERGGAAAARGARTAAGLRGVTRADATSRSADRGIADALVFGDAGETARARDRAAHARARDARSREISRGSRGACARRPHRHLRPHRHRCPHRNGATARTRAGAAADMATFRPRSRLKTARSSTSRSPSAPRATPAT